MFSLSIWKAFYWHDFILWLNIFYSKTDMLLLVTAWLLNTQHFLLVSIKTGGFGNGRKYLYWSSPVLRSLKIIWSKICFRLSCSDKKKTLCEHFKPCKNRGRSPFTQRPPALTPAANRPSVRATADVPESSEEGGVNRVAIVHIKVVPAAFSGKVVEP